MAEVFLHGETSRLHWRWLMADESNIFYTDCETLGLGPQHKAWEWALIVDGVEHQWFQKVLDDDIAKASPVALEMTGFRERYDHSAALSTDESTEKFLSLIGENRHWVGAVPSFDERHMRRQYIACITGDPHTEIFPWHYHLIDVENLIIGYLQRQRHIEAQSMLRDFSGLEQVCQLPWKSHALSAAIGVHTPKEDEHTALGDPRGVRKSYQKIFD